MSSTAILDDVFFIATANTFVINKKIHQANGRDEFEFAVKLTQDMIPSTSITVYYIHKSGEVVFDRVSVDVESSLKNQVQSKCEASSM